MYENLSPVWFKQDKLKVEGAEFSHVWTGGLGPAYVIFPVLLLGCRTLILNSIPNSFKIEEMGSLVALTMILRLPFSVRDFSALTGRSPLCGCSLHRAKNKETVVGLSIGIQETLDLGILVDISIMHNAYLRKRFPLI